MFKQIYLQCTILLRTITWVNINTITVTLHEFGGLRIK